jgi:ABC-2 type transport system ATP-binding protein
MTSNAAAIEVSDVSRWYGNVVAVNDITFTVGPGITGLLGPNGAGKSTLLHMLAGFLQPSSGDVRILGAPAWRNIEMYRQLGIVQERESVYDGLTGYEFVRLSARLHRLPNVHEATARAIERVQLTPAHGWLLERHEAADQDRRRHRARPDGVAPR